jgi:autotransporter-associated beta strand protein
MPIGALVGGDNSVQIGGSASPASDGNAVTYYSVGGLNTSTTFGGQLIDAGMTFRKVGTGTLTLTNNILSYGGATVVSNGTLAYAPLGNYGNFFATLGFNAFTNNYLVSSNFTIVSPGVLDLSQVPSNTLYLGHVITNSAYIAQSQTLFGSGTLNANLTVTNSTVAPGRRASFAGDYPSSLNITGNAVFGTNSTILMGFGTNTPVGYDNLNVLGTLTIQQASLVVVSNGAIPFPPLSTNVFRFFSNAVNVALGGFSGGITNITLPSFLPPGMFWVTNLNGTQSANYPTIPAGAMAIINTNNATSVLLLQGLVVTPLGVLTPAFTSNTFSYTAVESYLHSPITVTPTNWDTTASNRVIYLGVTNGVASGAASGSLALNANPNSNNVVVIKVTGQDGVSFTNYTVTVIRHPDLTPGLLAPVQVGSALTMSWPLSENGYQVQAQTNALGIGLSNNWTTVAGSTLTNTITVIVDSNQPSVFYRLINTNSP